VEIDQYDQDRFHGTSSFNASSLRAALRDAMADAASRAYPDTIKVVITVKREKLQAAPR